MSTMADVRDQLVTWAREDASIYLRIHGWDATVRRWLLIEAGSPSREGWRQALYDALAEGTLC